MGVEGKRGRGRLGGGGGGFLHGANSLTPRGGTAARLYRSDGVLAGEEARVKEGGGWLTCHCSCRQRRRCRCSGR